MSATESSGRVEQFRGMLTLKLWADHYGMASVGEAKPPLVPASPGCCVGTLEVGGILQWLDMGFPGQRQGGRVERSGLPSTGRSGSKANCYSGDWVIAQLSAWGWDGRVAPCWALAAGYRETLSPQSQLSTGAEQPREVQFAHLESFNASWVKVLSFALNLVFTMLWAGGWTIWATFQHDWLDGFPSLA